MNDRDFILLMLQQINIHLNPPIPEPPVEEAESPTGYEPKLLWTRKQQFVFNKMREEGEAGLNTVGAKYYRQIIAHAKSGARYGDIGMLAAIAYQMTGKPEFVEHAWLKMEKAIPLPMTDQNNNRESSFERVLLAEWLKPGLSEERLTAYKGMLDRLFTNATTPSSGTTAAFPLRHNDSDQVTGIYMGLAFYALAFPDHPLAVELFNKPFVGGFTSTGSNRITLRNCITNYIEMARGGEWMESGEYNLGTMAFLVLGAMGIKTATGVDHFPELTEWCKVADSRNRQMSTPDLAQSFQWGDEQEPRAYKSQLFRWSTLGGIFDSPVSRKYIDNLINKYGTTGASEMYPRALTVFNPYGSKEHPELPKIFDARGQGILSARTGWDEDASQLMVHLFPTSPPHGDVDHAVRYFGDIQLYRKKSWALTHPIAYSAVTNDGRGENVMLHCGIGTPIEFRGHQVVSSGPDWVYTAGTSGGLILASSFYQPPPQFWHEYSRMILWIQGEVDTIIVCDRSNLDDPKTLPRFDRYGKPTMSTSPLRQWLWHCPVIPAITNQSAFWPIPSGTARVSWLDSSLISEYVDQTPLWPASTLVKPTEKKFNLKLSLNTTGMGAYITVLEFGDPAKFGIISKPDFGSDIIGVDIHKEGTETIRALFNAKPGPRIPNHPGSVKFSGIADELLKGVRMCDLNAFSSAINIRTFLPEGPNGVVEI